MSKEKSFLVGFTFPDNGDATVAIVGVKQPKEMAKIVNAFTGKEAEDLYKLLSEQKKINKENS